MAPSTRNHARTANGADGSDGKDGPQSEQTDGASFPGNHVVPEPDKPADDIPGKEQPNSEEKDEDSKQVKPPLWLRDSRRAIFGGEFVWKTKPNPYEGNLMGKDEEQNDCEQRIRKELEAAWHTASRNLIAENEVETADFEWCGYQIHWEKFLKINMIDEKPFKDSAIFSRLQEEKEKAVANELEASLKARQMALADHYQKQREKKTIYQSNKGKGNPRKLLEPKGNIRESDQALYHGTNDDEIMRKWSELEGRYDSIFNSENKPKIHKDDVVYSTEELLVKIVESWSGWGIRVTADSVFQNQGDRIAAADATLLRPTPKDSIVILVDMKEKLLALLIPEAIQRAFSPEVRDRMLTDTKHLYTHIKYANSGHNKRHVSEQSHSSRRYGPPGSDHYGIWHEGGQTLEPLRETSDSSSCVPFVKQCLLHFLENTGGTMTKLLDFWFGVWEPGLREEYRDIYRGLPKYARLPPTNEDRDEIYTLRVIVVNRDTDHHRDQKDWKRGLTGLIQLGDFEGGGMCLEELGVRLDGYGDGAMLLFRGTELHHYVAPWNWKQGGYRFAFDHTTHESVRRVVQNKEAYPEYVEPEFPEDDPNYKPKPESKKKDHASDNETQGSRAKKGKGKKATAKKEVPEKKAPAKKAKGKGKAKADTHSELGDKPASEAVLDDDEEVVEYPHKTTAPRKRPVNEIADDEDDQSPISMNKRRNTARSWPVTESSDDEDNEPPQSIEKRPRAARTNKKDDAPKKLPSEPSRRSKRTR